MVSLAPLIASLRLSLAEWQQIRVADLQFWHRDTTRLTLTVFAGLSILLFVIRSMMTRRPGRDSVALPAVLRWVRPSSLAFVRHAPLVLSLAGLPFFALALADPYTSLTRQEVSFPGRRIAIMVDASSSMRMTFKAPRLTTGPSMEAAFFTTVAATERFIRLRMQGRYRDLMALIEFGNDAYVITPFTNDYRNILLSVSLIGDSAEWGRFPDTGTIIAQAIDEGVHLFQAFNFLNAAGNLMVIFSDGYDTEVTEHGKSLDDVLSRAVEARIPVYFIRVAYKVKLGDNVTDEILRAAVEKTGGRFYAGNDEDTILRAIREIDQVSAGQISMRQYSTQRPRFAAFALIAVGVWVAALGLKLMVPWFLRFP